MFGKDGNLGEHERHRARKTVIEKAHDSLTIFSELVSVILIVCRIKVKTV
jgi:hypothetical protein